MVNRSRNAKFLPVMLILLLTAAILFSGCVSLPDFEFSDKEDPSEPADLPVQTGDGNPLAQDNPYRDLYNPDGKYILPDSDQRYYTRAELQNLNTTAKTIALHEISARHGQLFDDPHLQEYFSGMPWYEPAVTAWAPNDYEKFNTVMLDVMLREAEGTLTHSGNAYITVCGTDGREQIADSSTRFLTADDLELLSKEELVIARTEIMARYGVVFSDPELLEFFCCMHGYTPSILEAAFDTESLNEYETANIQLIDIYEKLLAGDYKPAADNKYMPFYDPATEQLMETSSTEKLTYKDLAGRTPEELVVLRNEIIARHGLAFNHQGLMEYFTQCSWYRPSVAPRRSDLIHMSTVEYQNMDFIYAFEKDHTSVLDKDLTYRIETEYYSLYLPAYWKDLSVVYDSHGNIFAGDIHSLSFYEALSYESGWSGGHLFTIMLIPQGNDYDFPSYDYYGWVTDDYGNHYDVIIRYPTDVQFNDKYKALYQFMTTHTNEILATITFDG